MLGDKLRALELLRSALRGVPAAIGPTSHDGVPWGRLIGINAKAGVGCMARANDASPDQLAPSGFYLVATNLPECVALLGSMAEHRRLAVGSGYEGRRLD